MLSDPFLEVDGAAGIEALRLPLEVDFLTRDGVLVGHLTTVNDVFRVAMGRSFPAPLTLTGFPAGLFGAGPQGDGVALTQQHAIMSLNMMTHILGDAVGVADIFAIEELPED